MVARFHSIRVARPTAVRAAVAVPVFVYQAVLTAPSLMAATPPVTYRNVDPNADMVAQFARRNEHLLYMAEQTARAYQGWVAGMPVREALANNVVKMERSVVEEIVLPFVRLGDDARSVCYGDMYIREEAYSRMLSTVLQLAPGDGTVVGTLGTMYIETIKAYSVADDAVKDALTLRLNDLLPVEADVPQDETAGTDAEKAASVLYNQALGERRFLNFIKLEGLVASDGRLQRLAKLGAWIGDHITQAAREAPGFNRRLQMLRKSIEAKEGYDAMDNEELAEGVKSVLASTSVQPMLRRLCAGAGGPQARAEMRTWLQFWSNDTVGSENHLASVLRDTFVSAAAAFPALRALVGCDAGGLVAPVDASEAYQATSAVALRVGARTATDPFGPAAMAELAARIDHLTELLSSAPMVDNTMQERMDYVVTMLQQGARAELRSSSWPIAGVSASTKAQDSKSRLGAGTVPKHYQDRVASAQATSAYLLIKRGILARLAKGGEAADLDALQLAITGIIINDDASVDEARWAPLIHMMAEGDKRGLQADLVDPDLAPLATIARTAMPELVGRAVALQLSVRADELPEKLIGFELPEVVAATSGDDYSTLDLGGAYRKARAGLREEEPSARTDKPYATKSDCEDALKIAEVVLSLRGYPGSSRGTVPYALQQVIQTWELYGGDGCSESVRSKISEKGAAYIRETLKRFGALRHSMLSGKDPHSPRYVSVAPLQAIRAFDKHVTKLEGSMAVEGYIEYGGLKESGRSTETSAKKKPKGGGGLDSAGSHAGAKGWAIVPDHSRKVVAVTQHNQARGTYAFDKLNANALEGRRSCLRGLVLKGLRAANTISAEVATALKCTRCSAAAAEKTHAWHENSKLSQCKAGRGGASTSEDASAEDATDEAATGKRVRKEKKRKKEKPAAQHSEDEDEEEEGADEVEEDLDETSASGASGDETSEAGASPSGKRRKKAPSAGASSAARGAKGGRGKGRGGRGAGRGFQRQ